MRTFFAVLAVIAVLTLTGCTPATAQRASKVENNIKKGVAVADQSLKVIDALVGIVAPGSTAAGALDHATVIAQKVDGVVQNVSVTVPVTPTANTPTGGNLIQQDVKDGVQIAAESLTAVDAIVKTAAPGSTAANTLNQASVAAQKVNGVVQKVTIVIPVTPDAPLAAPAPAAVVPAPAGN